MFGDFSRFENDPEIGLNGIYLSQGSPILDSDWNEQMAALTDWITVVGKFVNNQREGLKVEVVGNNVTISRGIAICEGRTIQSASVRPGSFQDGTLIYPHMYSDGKIADPSKASKYFCVVSRSLLALDGHTGNNGRHARSVETTCWAVFFTDHDTEYQDTRTVGSGRHLVPQLKCKNVECFSPSTTTGLIECHWASPTRDEVYFKTADTPHNIVMLSKEKVEWIKNDAIFEVPIGECALLDILESGTTAIYCEFEDDRLAILQGAWTLHPGGGELARLHSASPIFRVTVERLPTTHRLRISGLSEPIQVTNDRRPCLRLWNKFLKQNELEKALSFEESPLQDCYLVTGDRWYIDRSRFSGTPPIRGHRVFRTLIKDGNLPLVPSLTHIPIKQEVLVAEVPRESPPLRVPTQPVAHRLDDSLHRLTGAINATRALTRQTPCKELKTRVSYLPLRRWLASTFVHEIVDLDLDSFLAKVQRSVDVAPEDGHRFREQAALILDEANQLAGRIPSRSDSAAIASTPTSDADTLSLNTGQHNILNDAFVRQFPRA